MNTIAKPVTDYPLIFVVLFCILAWLIFAFSTSAPEPIDPAHIPVIAAHRATIETCRNYQKCAGGFIRFKGVMTINRITDHRSGDGFWTIGAGDLVESMDLRGDEFLDRIQDIVLPGDPRWDDFVKRRGRQFVTAK